MGKNNNVLDDKLHWYKDAIIYELHIKAFRDSNGDGIGDFQGLLSKLDYLKLLGVTAIWVLPFYPSPLRDDGYDISDYYSINPSYGNMEQFKEFIKEAHKRKLKVITELVINHTSDQHAWFQRARRAPAGSVERNYYVWTDDPTQYKGVRIIFQDYELSNWTWDAVANQYYWHRFFHHQPDLNYENPKVQSEIFGIIDYWCAMGVDGFRLDAVPYLFEAENTNSENLPATHAYLKRLRKHVDEHYPGTVLLAEANMWPEDSASYFGNGDECHMNYHFPVMPRMFMALQREDRYPITDIFDQTPPIPETCQWAIFLRNHDELTLEMVTDEERDYMYKVYAKDPKAKINLGIRHRLGPLMENNRRKIELMNCLLFSLPGTPVLYYGDEIGMGDNIYLGDRDGVRTPMQWSPDRNAGFSEANPQKLYLPVILDPEYHYESVNVETQQRNPSSLYWFMRHRMDMRKKHKAFSRGDMKFIQSENPKILAFTRSYEEETILIVVNLSRYTQPVELDLEKYLGYTPMEVFSKNKFPAIKEDGSYFLTMGPHDHHWFLLEKVAAEFDDTAAMPGLDINRLQELLENPVLEMFTMKILPKYISKVRWYDKKDRAVHNITISDQFEMSLSGSNALFILFDVSYESGFPDAYILPVCFMDDVTTKKLSDNYPQSVICKMRLGKVDGYLVDAYYKSEIHHAFIRRFASRENIVLPNSQIVFSGNERLKKYANDNTEIKSKILPIDNGNTSVGYDNCYFLKLYRHLDRTTNPDVEMTKFLTERKNYKQVPLFLGTIEWKYPAGAVMLGMFQILVEYHGNGKSYMLERLNNYYERIEARLHYPPYELMGSLADPVAFELLPEDLKEFIGGTVAEGTRLIGVRTGEMHKTLASETELPEFIPEEFSLHYQRSLYSGFQSLVRRTFDQAPNHIHKLSAQIRGEVEEMIGRRDEILKLLERIYAKKYDVLKIRIHGNYDLEHVLFTGKDVAILDFHGDPFFSYSERRLKRSPLRDIAGMIRSLYYVAYHALLLNNEYRKDNQIDVENLAKQWVHYVSGFFMHAYLDTVHGSPFIPDNKTDLRVLLETYLIEKAVQSFNHELKHRPDRVIVPLRILQSIIGFSAENRRTPKYAEV